MYAYIRPHLTHHTFSHHPPPKTPQKDRGYTRSSAVVSPKRDRLLTYLLQLSPLSTAPTAPRVASHPRRKSKTHACTYPDTPCKSSLPHSESIRRQ